MLSSTSSGRCHSRPPLGEGGGEVAAAGLSAAIRSPRDACSRHGHLIVPHGSNVGIYDLHGPGGVTQHSQITPASIGLSKSTYVSACESHSRTLLLADAARGGSDVVALHVDTHSVIWRSDAFDASSGIAVLGEQVRSGADGGAGALRGRCAQGQCKTRRLKLVDV